MIVSGLDLSLQSTGLAVIDSLAAGLGRARAVRLQPPKDLDSYERLRYIADWALNEVADSCLVAVEGPAYNKAVSAPGQAHERAGLWWLVTLGLHESGIPFAVVVPSTRAKYATGNGRANKDQVLAAAVRRFPEVEFDGNDQGDALVMAAMGADHLGFPLVRMPELHRKSLAAVKWPELRAACA